MMGERGVVVNHATVRRWAVKILRVLASIFRLRKRSVVAGPRQLGKTTPVRDALTNFSRNQYRFDSVDRPDDEHLRLSLTGTEEYYKQDVSIRDDAWLVRQWQRARKRPANQERPIFLY